MTLEKITKIIMKVFGTFVITMLLHGCVTKKKFKESQELQSTYIIDQTETKWTNSVQNIENKFSESTLRLVNEYLKFSKESTLTNENESTDISVNIKAEDGKEKTATIGKTTVTSNGADITVKTTSTKAINKQLETINKELTQSINEVQNSLKTVKNEINEYKKHVKKLEEEIKSFSETKNKETNKKGFNFWFIFPLILALILFIFYCFRNRFSAFNKLKYFFIGKQ